MRIGQFCFEVLLCHNGRRCVGFGTSNRVGKINRRNYVQKISPKGLKITACINRASDKKNIVKLKFFDNFGSIYISLAEYFFLIVFL